MLIKNRTDIPVPSRWRRQFELPDGLTGNDLADAIKEKIGLEWSYLSLERANFNAASLTGVRAEHARLDVAELNDADLSDAELSHARLEYVKLCNAELKGAELHGAQMYEAKLNGARNIAGEKMIGALNLSTAHHERLIKIDVGANPLIWRLALFVSTCAEDDILCIKCETRSIREWEGMAGDEARLLGYGAIEFYRNYRDKTLKEAKRAAAEFREKE